MKIKTLYLLLLLIILTTTALPAFSNNNVKYEIKCRNNVTGQILYCAVKAPEIKIALNKAVKIALSYWKHQNINDISIISYFSIQEDDDLITS